MTEIPVLATARLVLRAPHANDFPAYRDFMASPRAIHMGGPFDLKAAWGMFCNDLALWSLYGHGCLMIDLRENGATVGQVGINHGPLFPEKELGWFLYEGYEGAGIAHEAALAMRDWAFVHLGPSGLVSYCDPANARSIALAERLGGRLDPTAVGQDPEDLVFRHRPPV
ncbi:GNAT family N-acetyltransferase [Devosia sp. SD17-2]|uniref:GNAT family N-acetyltransferase n=1 Tax=Devosia sp. SD17-2 TaxID=2976459 RepID=UPI0023D80C9E|nr:GNAT family N-acetyltransferase [Devosia sp. SD17-2]WEJ33756.1 GNAT family N-acetyltransferase [Devosia sp. SD17-2]